MSLQDDIFEVSDAVKDTQYAGNFDRIMDAFNIMERRYEEMQEVLQALGVLRRHFNKMTKENGE